MNMKTHLSICLILLLSIPFFLRAQDDEHEQKTRQVPAAVKAAFQKKFPAVKQAAWEMEKENYEAEFKQGGKEYEAEFDRSGNWIGTEYKINIAAIPAPVMDAFKRSE